MLTNCTFFWRQLATELAFSLCHKAQAASFSIWRFLINQITMLHLNGVRDRLGVSEREEGIKRDRDMHQKVASTILIKR